MAARSFTITIDNLTGLPWHRIGLGLDHGEWSNNGGSVPPENIPGASFDVFGHLSYTPVTFGNESDGFATGAQGFVDYQNALGSILHIAWDNPYIGSNSFDANASNPFTASYGDISGNNANVVVEVK
ncbi:aegerolysin family protein [Nostoc sp.]|uniref:aegerolysin family protein n=1 Tax=Nostoc sp. TaxID=1180 RepID=UPI002FF52C92